MAVSPIGFEGFEKRLEMTFSGLPDSVVPAKHGLRDLTRAQLDSILEPACCTIVSQLSNFEFDSYLLSESSLFVYPLKIIIKTCGTTKLLLSIPPILKFAHLLSFGVTSVKYSRGTFIFPGSQPAPHRSFAEEVDVLNKYFDDLDPKAYVIGDPNVPNHQWHVYSAAKSSPLVNDRSDVVTLEMCMTGLDRDKAAMFYKKLANSSAKDMTKLSRISEIIPSHLICDFGFEPCGYSMNGIEDAAFSTVHVTPEDGFSYASYEAMGFDIGAMRLEALVKRVLRCFSPAEFMVAVTCPTMSQDWAMELAVVEGYLTKNVLKQDLPCGGCLMYRSFARESAIKIPWWRSLLSWPSVGGMLISRLVNPSRKFMQSARTRLSFSASQI